MLKAKYNYKDFIEIYLQYQNSKNGTQENEYYSLLYNALSKYFEVYIADIVHSSNIEDYEAPDDYISLGILDDLISEYFSFKDVLKNQPIDNIGILNELDSKFNPQYLINTEKRKKLLFEMIYFLFCKHYGKSKKTITHKALIELNYDLFRFENSIAEILIDIYDSRQLKNNGYWSLVYYKEELAEKGYNCILPNDIDEIITIGNCQIKSLWFSGIGYKLKPTAIDEI